jgi:hypothetical protein
MTSTGASPSPAPSYEGPYALLEEGRNLLPNDAELEDPCIWWANNQYNVLLNDWKGKANGHVQSRRSILLEGRDEVGADEQGAGLHQDGCSSTTAAAKRSAAASGRSCT